MGDVNQDGAIVLQKAGHRGEQLPMAFQGYMLKDVRQYDEVELLPDREIGHIGEYKGGVVMVAEKLLAKGDPLPADVCPDDPSSTDVADNQGGDSPKPAPDLQDMMVPL
jgi:hypothetical protein